MPGIERRGAHVMTPRQATRANAAKELACHDDALHLVGALVDLGDLRVAHHPLEREVAGVAGPAEQLHGIRGHLHRDVGGVALGRGAEERQVGVAALGLGRGDVDHLAGGLELHRHVGEHELHALEVGDRLAELAPLPDVRERLVERPLGDADGLGADGDAGVVERREGDLQPGADLADDAVAGDAGAVEDELAGGAALDAELALLLAEGEARVALLHDERGDVVAALAVGVGHGEHRVVLGDTGVGDPGLLAGEHPVVAVTHRAALHRGGVGAGLALREPVRERGLPRRERGEVAGLDVVVRGDDQRHRAELVDRGDQRAARADPGDLLDDDAGRQGVGPHAAVLLGHVRREEVAGHEGVVRLLRVAGLLVDRRRVGGDLVLGHRPDGLSDRLVVLGEPVGVEVRVRHDPMLLSGMPRARRGRCGFPQRPAPRPR